MGVGVARQVDTCSSGHLSDHQGQCLSSLHVRWCTNVDTDLKIFAVGIDPSEEQKTTKVLCLSLMAEGLSMLLTLAGKLVGISPEWKHTLEVLAIMLFILEIVVKGWGFSGGQSARDMRKPVGRYR
jgi:hypothetical protein